MVNYMNIIQSRYAILMTKFLRTDEQNLIFRLQNFDSIVETKFDNLRRDSRKWLDTFHERTAYPVSRNDRS